MTGKSLLRHGLSLSLLTLISRLLGLVREMTKAALLGTSAAGDAFSVAFMLPNLFRRLFAEGSISAAFIPTFKSILIDNDEKKTKEFLNCFWTFLFFAVTLFCIIGILCAPLIIKLFKLGAGEFGETVFLTRLMFPFLAFVSIAALFQGILNSVHVFAPGGFAPIALNIAVIACAWFLRDKLGGAARAMAAGVLLGGFLEAALQAPFLYKYGFRLFFTNLKKALSNPGTRQVLRLIGPTIIGMAAYQLNDLVSTALASGAGRGVVSSLQYSLRLQELLLGIFAVSIGTVLLPGLTEHVKKEEWNDFNIKLGRALEIIALIMVPVTFFSLSEGEALIRLLFEMREFNEESVHLTLSAFNCHIAGLYFIALNRVLAPAFYTQRDSKSPTIAGIASFAVNIALASILDNKYKGAGIAAALSISGAVNTIILFFLLRKKTRKISVLKKSILYFLKIIALSFIALFFMLFIKRITASFFNGKIIPFLISVISFTLAGCACLLITRDRNIATIVRRRKK